MVEITHDVYSGTSNGDKMGDGGDKMSFMCAMMASALTHLTFVDGCRLFL